jgi:hypothetical protein
MPNNSDFGKRHTVAESRLYHGLRSDQEEARGKNTKSNKTGSPIFEET